MNTTFWTAVVTAVLSSTGLFGVVTTIMTRRQRKMDEENKRESERLGRERAETDRHDLLAEAQSTAQRTALDSANERYDRLREDYGDTRQTLQDIRDATGNLITVVETLLIGLTPGIDKNTYTVEISLSTLRDARKSINDARRYLG